MFSNISDGVDVFDVSQFANEPSGPLFLDQLHCSGDENSLTECSFSLIHMCSHQQDIGIICHCKYIDHVLWIKSATTYVYVYISDIIRAISYFISC